MDYPRNQSAVVAIIVAIIVAIVGPVTVWSITKSNQDSQAVSLQATLTILQTQVTTENVAPITATCLVPNVVGQDQRAAEGLIGGIRLEPVITTVYDPNVPTGSVISQDPPSGTERNPCQGKVTIVISLGSVPPPPTITPIPPTITPIPPTITPIPTVTPISATAPGTVLRNGETWYADGWSLTVSGFTYQTLDNIHLTLRNRTGRTVVFPIVNTDVTVIPDKGNKKSCAQNNWAGLHFSQTEMKPDDYILAIEDCGSFEEYFSSPRNLTLVVVNIADIIVNAQWQTDIPRP